MDPLIHRSSFSSWRRLQNAAPATFLIYLSKTLFAFCIAAPVADTIERYILYSYTLSGTVSQDLNGPLLIDALEFSWPEFREYRHLFLAVAVLYLMVTPLLTLTWLGSLSKPIPVSVAVEKSVHRYGRGLTVFCLYLIALLSIVLLSGVGCYFIRYIPLFPDDDRARDLVLLLALVPGVLALLFVYFLHDVSMAAVTVSDYRCVQAVKSAFRAATRSKIIWAFAGWQSCIALIALAGLCVSAFARPLSGSCSLSILALSQLLVAVRVVLRGRWLASLVQ